MHCIREDTNITDVLGDNVDEPKYLYVQLMNDIGINRWEADRDGKVIVANPFELFGDDVPGWEQYMITTRHREMLNVFDPDPRVIITPDIHVLYNNMRYTKEFEASYFHVAPDTVLVEQRPNMYDIDEPGPEPIPDDAIVTNAIKSMTVAKTAHKIITHFGICTCGICIKCRFSTCRLFAPDTLIVFDCAE